MKKFALLAGALCASLWTTRAEDVATKAADEAAVKPVEAAVTPAEQVVKPVEEAVPPRIAKPDRPKIKPGRDGAGPLLADTNGDGVLSLDEFKVQHDARTAKRKEKMGDKFDATKVPTAEAAFAKLDKNGDGSLSKDELLQGHQPGKRPGKKPEVPAATPEAVL
jgi:hypothetical protein